MPATTSGDLFIDGARDIDYAERKIMAGLKRMIRGAKSRQLRPAFETHLRETEGQVQRLLQVFKLLGKPARGTNCPAIDVILEEGSEVVEEITDSKALDAGLLAAAQTVEHYEFARYGTLASRAMQLGQEIAQPLGQSLAEETKTDQLLTRRAEAKANGTAKRSD